MHLDCNILFLFLSCFSLLLCKVHLSINIILHRLHLFTGKDNNTTTTTNSRWVIRARGTQTWCGNVQGIISSVEADGLDGIPKATAKQEQFQELVAGDSISSKEDCPFLSCTQAYEHASRSLCGASSYASYTASPPRRLSTSVASLVRSLCWVSTGVCSSPPCRDRPLTIKHTPLFLQLPLSFLFFNKFLMFATFHAAFTFCKT